MNNSSDNYHRFPFETATGLKFIDLSKLKYCRASTCYTDFIMENPDDNFDSSYPLAVWEYKLSRWFCRISDSHLLNKEQVSEYLNSKSGTVILKDGETLTVSQGRKEFFYSAMGYERPRKSRKTQADAYCNECCIELPLSPSRKFVVRLLKNLLPVLPIIFSIAELPELSLLSQLPDLIAA